MTNEILQGSVFDRINDVPDGWADVILTDPPYNSGGTARARVREALEGQQTFKF